MTDAKTEAERRIYKRLTCRQGFTWYVPTTEEPDQWVHLDTGGGEGYGGREVHFRLEDGSVDVVKGPWNVPADWVRRATGHDVRSTEAGKEVSYTGGRW